MTTDLIERYSQARLPRYTSYPPAPHFTPWTDAATYGAWLDALGNEADLSLYLHVPFCAALCLYCGCTTTVARRYGPVEAYVDLLEREIELVAGHLKPGASVRHLHWGGGTPTILRGSDLRRVGAQLSRHLKIAPDAEIAVEIDPRSVTPAHVEALALIGVNRASLGVQSFEPQVQRAIGRVQSFEETARVAQWLRFAGIEALSLDLMYGLPFQTSENVVATVSRALALDPDRISLFGYAHVPWVKRHQALIPEDALPGPAERVAQFTAAAARLEDAGYVRIGLDHFARADDPLARSAGEGQLKRNFQGYTTDRAPALIGLGASAISRLPQGYAQNAPGVPAYRAAIEAGHFATVRGHVLTPDDHLRGAVIERLMCDLSVDLDEVCASHGVSAAYFSAELARIDTLAQEGLARRCGTRIEVEEDARDLVRAVSAVFDARAAAGIGAPRHSPAV